MSSGHWEYPGKLCSLSSSNQESLGKRTIMAKHDQGAWDRGNPFFPGSVPEPAQRLGGESKPAPSGA